AIRSSMKAHRLDVRTDHGPLARPILAYGLAAMDVATIHTVGPDDIIGEHGQHTVYVPRVEEIVDAFKDFDVIVHWVSPYIQLLCTYASGLDAIKDYLEMEQRWLDLARSYEFTERPLTQVRPALPVSTL